jgi:uncharacterized protein (DUF169 family)
MVDIGALEGLNLNSRPVAIAFLDAPPAGMTRIGDAQPAGCAFWKHAAAGHSFYTLPEDHYNCPVGAFTHHVDLPPAQQSDLEGLVGTMIQLQYIGAEEVPSLPRRRQALNVAVYAPLDAAPFDPDVVIVRGNARQLMLVAEAARAAGTFGHADIMGRPACAMVPQAMNSGSVVASFGCIGNRVYTGLGDDELYVSIPGSGLARTLEKLTVILNANSELEAFHRGRFNVQ